MKIIKTVQIEKLVARLAIEANLILRRDVYSALRRAYLQEKNQRGRKVLKAIIDNAAIAREEKLAICQDTGMPCVFVELGQEVIIKGDLKKAINRGIEKGYKEGFFRNSIVKDPLFRGRGQYNPAMIHMNIVLGNKLKITILPKGFGCENKARLKMFNPTARIQEVKKFIVDTVKDAGPDACPPYIVGVGIGGTADYACLMAKKALLKKIDIRHSTVDRLTCKLEKQLLDEINRLSIGPMGFGGKVTCLGVNIETYPTHIAGLPVAVNISCHALRSASSSL
ncbi:MAG: fumarate hydratase [Candidatus Omnitrophota bacterium]|nr:fumarate hydratase [Candidatus Omnitrophota bacterium]